MSNAIYIASTEPFCGKTVIALGLTNLLAGKAKKIAYFKPVINEPSHKGKDIHIKTIATHFGLTIPYEDMFSFTRDEVLQHRSNGNTDFVIDTIITKYKKLEETHDFILVEGTDFMGDGLAFEFDANISIAKNLGIPALLIMNANGDDVEDIANNIVSNYKSFDDKEVQVLAIVANKTNPLLIGDLTKILSNRLPKDLLRSVIPSNKNLGNPTMKEICEAVNGKVLFGKSLLSNQVDHEIVGAMQLRNCLLRLKENTLIVTPGDRGDIILAALQANLSKNYPKIAGLILTGGLEPEPPILQLIEGLQTVVPIIQVETGTFQTVNLVGSTQSNITADNKEKIELAISLFEQYVDTKSFEDKLITFQPEGITPRMFQYQLLKRAKSQKKHIVLPEGNDDRVLAAAAQLVKKDVVELTILGNEADIKDAIIRLNLSLNTNDVHIINPARSPLFEDYAATLYELRKTKNVTLEMARDLMTDVSYFGTMMVYKGHADGMVSGALHTTQHTIRPALQFVKTKPNVNTVSSVFFMCLPDRVCVFGDCAVNPNPTSEQLAEIAISSAESSIMFGLEPRVAMLSYSSGTSGEGADVEKVRRATEIVKQQRPDLKIEGPIQYDAAVDPTVGKQKLPNSLVAGQASVLIFPDLNTGNNTYKAVQRETGALAIGPMLQGLNKPVNDLSRGCTIDDIFNTVIITAIQAQQ
ncbi:MAG TPA: phosphate acetyltransferase [Chitinophagaceae bacterium]|nr:phosphate acetyltransferase [Chitinophagaceae bacterium]